MIFGCSENIKKAMWGWGVAGGGNLEKEFSTSGEHWNFPGNCKMPCVQVSQYFHNFQVILTVQSRLRIQSFLDQKRFWSKCKGKFYYVFFFSSFNSGMSLSSLYLQKTNSICNRDSRLQKQVKSRNACVDSEMPMGGLLQIRENGVEQRGKGSG